MRRRDFIGLVGSAATAWPLAVRAQQSSMPVVGILYSSAINFLQDETSAFKAGLAEIGYIDGRNVSFDYRAADNRMDRLPVLANELVDRRVAVIFSASTAAAVLAAKAATVKIPIVFSMGADPVGIGAVASLARPGGNITGITVLAGELIGKRFEFLREIVPTAATIAYLVNTANPAFSEAALKIRTENARAAGRRLLIVNASGPNDVDRAFESAVAENAGALLVGPDTLFQMQREQIVALAARYRIPTSYPWPEDVRSGGLFSYGADFLDVFRKAGIYVGRILNGEKAADLPVQQPTRFRLAVNLKTAKALGLEVPPHILARADEVIE
ncbi:MAG: ABC transporter substrate-binding protein [bacterium]|nr:ABC transporter substrate-binding protein [bacterium]